ncbi:hypothetical protein MMC14_005511 [Varicellaria rhodocarpa]|nr:hypothetical protein [Varicellaria rhodocarpa]
MAHSVPYGQLSLMQKLDFVLAIIQILITGVYSTLTTPFRGENGAPSFKKHIGFKMIRMLYRRMSVEQLQAMNPPSEDVYKAFAKEKGFKPESVTFGDVHTKAHWLGNKNAENLILWFPGGGYALPPTRGHYAFPYELVEKKATDAAVLMLDYTLTHAESYPHQLIQAVDMLRYAINSLGKHPSNIIVIGDSAGGNLALGLLSHLSHPHPSIAPLEMPALLKGMVLLSPWTSFDISFNSYSTNEYKDLVEISAVQAWSEAYVTSAALDVYNSPDKAPVGWWAGMKVGDVLITGGADERMIDTIRDVGETIKAAYPRTTLFIAEKEFHDQPVLRYVLDLEEGEQARMTKAWIKERL